MQISWAESLMNGLLPATGSALLTGAVLRLRRRPDAINSLIAGLGISTLALTRPFEGLCCTVLCSLLFLLLSPTSTWNACFRRMLRMAIPASVPIAFAFALIVAQNFSTTGRWNQMAYQLHEQKYGVAPLFVFSSPRLENVEPHADLSDTVSKYHAVECLAWYRQRIGLYGWLRGINDGISAIGMLSFPMALLLLTAGRRWMRLQLPIALIGLCSLQLAASATVCWVYPHYLAPLFPWILLVIMIAFRVSHWQRTYLLQPPVSHLNGHGVSADRLAATFAMRPIVRFALVVLVMIQAVSMATVSGVAKEKLDASWAKKRQQIERSLKATGGKHLVFVEYSADHNVHHEWVYNDADPMSSPIVWARSEHGRWTTEVMDSYGAGRRVWKIDADSVSQLPSAARLHESAPPTQ
jgi:hypothetical protein